MNDRDRPEPDAHEPRVPDPADKLPPSFFAVPERGERHRMAIEVPVVVPEALDEDEEELVHVPGDVALARRSFAGERHEKWFVLLLFLCGSLAILATSADVGMCWDEAYYHEAGLRTVAWFGECFSGTDAPLSGPRLDFYWDAATLEPRGHPSVTRLLVALGLAAPGGARFPLFAMRWPIALCFGLTLAALYLLARRSYGRVTAWIAVVAYLLMPRVFGHAHFAVTETPTVLTIVLTVYAFLRGLESRRWAVLTGVCFGLALATKINALFLPAILLPWAFFFRRREVVANFYAMTFIGPLVMAALWPWMWEKPLLHFAKYLLWNFDHRQIGVLYRGLVYSDSTGPAPWHYPLMLIALTLPISTLALAILGVARTLQAPRKQFLGLLFLWAALLPCLVQMLGSTPSYDGVRLFLPAVPFIAILAGVGGGVLVRIGAFSDRAARRFSRGRLVLVLLLGGIVAEGSWALISVYPLSLTYFNPFAGERSAAFEQMEMTYWGEALNKKALERINAIVPDGASLTPRALNIETLRICQRWGWLKSTIELREDRDADYHLLQYRRGMFAKPDWTLYKDKGETFERQAAFPSSGVPMIGLYRTGLAFEEYWRSQ